MWTTKKFQFLTLLITCNEDHIVWQEGVLNRRDLKLYYRDMISVSGADGAKHLGGTSRFEINTAGQTYSYSSTLGGFNGIENCIDIINERIQFFKSKDAENQKQLEIEKGRFLAEAVARAVQEQTEKASNNVKQVNGVNINPNNIEPTITRIELFLEEQDWDKAKAYAETALDYFPTDYRLYLFLLCIDMKVTSPAELVNSASSINENPNYIKAIRFADDAMIESLEKISAAIEENSMREQMYSNALNAMNNRDYELAYSLFESVPGYKDADSFKRTCAQKASDEKEEADKKKKQQLIIEQNAIKKIERAEDLLKQRTQVMKSIDTDEIVADGGAMQVIENTERELLDLAGIHCDSGEYAFDDFDGIAFTIVVSNADKFKTLDSCNKWKIIYRKEHYVLLFDSSYAREEMIVTDVLKSGRTYSREYIENYLNGPGEDSLLSHSLAKYKRLFVSPSDVYNNETLPKSLVFILSKKEIEDFLPSKESRKLCSRDNPNEYLRWHVRSDTPSSVTGVINNQGEYIEEKVYTLIKGTASAAVRPAIWIDLSRIPEFVKEGAKGEILEKVQGVLSSKYYIADNDLNYTAYSTEGYTFLIPKKYAQNMSDSNDSFNKILKRTSFYGDGVEIIVRVSDISKDYHSDYVNTNISKGGRTIINKFEKPFDKSLVSVLRLEKNGEAKGVIAGCYTDKEKGVNCEIRGIYPIKEGEVLYNEIVRMAHNIRKN